MPSFSGRNDGAYREHCRRLAEAQVAAKFPNLPKDSSGWARAVQNRYRRILRTH